MYFMFHTFNLIDNFIHWQEKDSKMERKEKNSHSEIPVEKNTYAEHKHIYQHSRAWLPLNIFKEFVVI